MADPADLERHYDECRRLFDEACAATGMSYLGRDQQLLIEKVPADETASLVSPEASLCVYRTSECAVDVRGIADRLSAAVRSNPRIRFSSGTSVLSVTRSGADNLCVASRNADGEHREVYDHVAKHTVARPSRKSIPPTGWLPSVHGFIVTRLVDWINLPVDRATVPSVTSLYWVLSVTSSIWGHAESISVGIRRA